MEVKKIRFNTEDGIELFGLLHLPNEATKKVVVCVHGMASNCFGKRDDVFAEQLTNKHIAYFSFNNRGANYAYALKRKIEEKEQKIIAGASYEDILESHNDIVGAVNSVKENGFEEIHLLGHSLGCTKIVYYFNKVKPNDIKSISLLSLTDIVDCQNYFVKDKKDYYLDLAIEKVNNKENYSLMPMKAFIHPISANTYLRYFKDNSEINFVQYRNNDYDFKELNNINIPIFIRFGTVNETLVDSPENTVNLLKQKLVNNKLDIGIIQDASHSYEGKENEVIAQVINFIENGEYDAK